MAEYLTHGTVFKIDLMLLADLLKLCWLSENCIGTYGYQWIYTKR